MDDIQINRQSDNRKYDNSHGNSNIQRNYMKIQMMRQTQRRKWGINTKNIISYFPTYTTLVDNHVINHLYSNKTQNSSHRTSFTSQKQKKKDGYRHSQNENERGCSEGECQIMTDQIMTQRNKWTQIRKMFRKERKSLTRDNGFKQPLHNSFFNIQKVPLISVRQSPSNREKSIKRSIGSTMVTVSNNRTLIIPKRITNQETFVSLDEYPILPQAKNVEKEKGQKQRRNSKDFYNTRSQFSVPKISKAFIAPFERYHYYDFLWKIALSNGYKSEYVQYLPKKYKVYIGPGNNSMLLKTFFKRREYWWALTDRIEQANFIWTQIKVVSIFNDQKSVQKQPFISNKKIVNEEVPIKKTVQLKKNEKILSKQLLQKWCKYYDENRQNEQKLLKNFMKRNKLFKSGLLMMSLPDSQSFKIHNHLPRNFVLGNKKALFATMKRYYECMKQDVFNYLPLTFHIENGLEDKEYFKFLKYFYKKGKESRMKEDKNQKVRNIWIVKPGEFTNRGNGITVCKNLDDIKQILKSRKKLDNGSNRTYIVQQYLDSPFLYCKRKFDIRHYMLITCVNGNLKGYWYEYGYIRTTSYEYSVKNSLSSVHLTNDAVQKMLPDYGKYEKGNKLSYDEFEKYLEKEYKGKYSFYKTIYPQMKKMGYDSMKACALLIDNDKKCNNFEVFGFDFMIDSNFHPWLIEINTNPCLELSCPVLVDIIPDMIENSLKIGVDSILPPPYSFGQKRPRFSGNILEQNHYELLYDSLLEQEELRRIYEDGEDVGLNFKQLQKQEDQVYEDDGVQLEDD